MQAQKLGWEAVLQRGQHKQRLGDSNVCLSPSVLGSEVGEESEPHRVMIQNWVDTEKFEKGAGTVRCGPLCKRHLASCW